MKTITKTIVALFIFTMLFTSCSKDDGGSKQRDSEKEIITAKASDFGEYHPCGIAISPTGKQAVAVSTYEGDTQNGKIFIWESTDAFYADEPAKYAYSVKDPEAITFDGNTLYIACTYDSKIFYTTDITKAPDSFFYIDFNDNHNPRGLSVKDGNLYVMCENLYPNPKKSIVLKVTNPTANNRTFSEVGASEQPSNNGNALSVFIKNNEMYTTDLNSNTVSRYQLGINGGSVQLSKRLNNAGTAMDVTADGVNYVYFTTLADACYLVRWNTASGETKNVKLGPANGLYAAWGVYFLNGKILIADAPRNQIKVVDVTTAAWQD